MSRLARAIEAPGSVRVKLAFAAFLQSFLDYTEPLDRQGGAVWLDTIEQLANSRRDGGVCGHQDGLTLRCHRDPDATAVPGFLFTNHEAPDDQPVDDAGHGGTTDAELVRQHGGGGAPLGHQREKAVLGDGDPGVRESELHLPAQPSGRTAHVWGDLLDKHEIVRLPIELHSYKVGDARRMRRPRRPVVFHGSPQTRIGGSNVGTLAGGPGTWGDPGFVERWVSRDVGGGALQGPRGISAALVADAGIDVRRVVDVGAGPGSYLRVMLETFPAADGVWVDVSEAMLERAKEELIELGPRVRFVVTDLRNTASLPLASDVIVSSRAIHHFRPETIKAFYSAAAAALTPGGFIFNLDHFAPPGDWRERYKRIKHAFVPRAPVTGEPHEHDAPPQPVGDHLRWLRDAGFTDPDVPWRLFWTALLAARAPLP